MSDLTKRLRDGEHGFDRNGSHSEGRYVCLCEHLANQAADRIEALEECERGCICKGNWRKIVEEIEPLIGRRFVDRRRGEFVLIGVIHGGDDYYYGMADQHKRLHMLSCAGSLEAWGMALIPSQQKHDRNGES